jgi:hypothetical protein
MYSGRLTPGFRIPLLPRKVGLQAPSLLLAPAGTPSVRQKNRQVTYTAEVCETVAGLMQSTLACVAR